MHIYIFFYNYIVLNIQRKMRKEVKKNKSDKKIVEKIAMHSEKSKSIRINASVFISCLLFSYNFRFCFLFFLYFNKILSVQINIVSSLSLTFEYPLYSFLSIHFAPITLNSILTNFLSTTVYKHFMNEFVDHTVAQYGTYNHCAAVWS